MSLPALLLVLSALPVAAQASISEKQLANLREHVKTDATGAHHPGRELCAALKLPVSAGKEDPYKIKYPCAFFKGSDGVEYGFCYSSVFDDYLLHRSDKAKVKYLRVRRDRSLIAAAYYLRDSGSQPEPLRDEEASADLREVFSFLASRPEAR